MVIENLQFFDYNGYNLNFEWNKKQQYWEGSIFLPKVSVGLYANTSIYVLEKYNNSSSNNNTFTKEYVFPYGNGKITFSWDKLNKFVDEFFMFNFDDDYVIKETSALVYTPNDGPDGNTLIINRFDTYDIPLSDVLSPKALPIHIAFMANERYDATTYNRTLVMSYNKKTIARITFFAETVEEDERLKIWNQNLGYNITPEDEMIFYKSDIKEYMPDYILLNEKRKELMMEGSNIYPYIGSYKAIINALKFFGYENLNIIEYWRNVNPNDENFGKIYHSSKYSLTHKETLRIGSTNIVLPNKDYKKINALALVYSINEPTGEVDEWELPLVREKFTYTIEEALIKLFALRKKLNKEFMPGTSRIIDIIGEANYFGLQGLKKIYDEDSIYTSRAPMWIDFDAYPSKYIHITDNTYFCRYVKLREEETTGSPTPIRNQMLSDLFNVVWNEIGSEGSASNLLNMMKDTNILSNNDKCNYYKDYYREAFEEFTVNKAIENNDIYPFDSPEYNYPELNISNSDDQYYRFSAKVVLTNTSFDVITFDNCDLRFNCEYKTIDGTNENYTTSTRTANVTFNTIDSYNKPDMISWKITMSKDQHDDELRKVGIEREYKYHDLVNLVSDPNDPDYIPPYIVAEKMEKKGSITDCSQFFAELPFVGYYDVTITLGYDDGTGNMVEDTKQIKTMRKCIKVEPYNIDVIGFYYDARELPEKIRYSNPEDSSMYQFIQDSITHMHGWATSERTTLDIDKDMSMPYYTVTGDIISPGPYYNDNVNDEWYLADNLTYEISELKPFVKYTRYIRSGVDVKPYTWFLLGYEYSKIAGKVNPKWTITNISTGNAKTWEGRYLTLLLKKEGNYNVELTIEDKLGNEYTVSRNIIVVSKTANYKLYQTFKKEYDYITEQEMLKQLNEYYASDKEDIS